MSSGHVNFENPGGNSDLKGVMSDLSKLCKIERKSEFSF